MPILPAWHRSALTVATALALLDMLAYSLAPCLLALIFLVFHISKADAWSVTAMLVVLMLNNYARVMVACAVRRTWVALS